MKSLAIVLGFILCLGIGALVGRSYNIQETEAVLKKDCEKLGKFAVGNRVYECQRVKKEKQRD